MQSIKEEDKKVKQDADCVHNHSLVHSVTAPYKIDI